MGLIFKYKAKDEIPAEHQSFYVEREGAWILDAEGVVEKTKLEEFRSSNAALTKERDELRQRFDGIDPEEVRKLAEDKQKLEEAQQVKAGEVEKVIENRLRAAKNEWDKQFCKLASERDGLTARLTAIQIDQGVTTVATKKGLRPSAIPDITARARIVFKLVNGLPRAFEADGQTLRIGKDGMSPMTLDEWVDTQVAEAPHLFETNVGGGATGASARPGVSQGKNPWLKGPTFNLTEQMTIYKADPQLAARL